MLNRIVLIGRLTKDPELRYTPTGGAAVTTFTLAVDRRFKQQGQQEADFIPVVAWKQLAETCAKYLGKGRQVAVEGRLQIRSYEDREGVRRTAAEVVADNVQFLGSPRERHEAAEQPAFDDSLIREEDIPF
ncbi:MAG: single-stranded DNA-binding protein [Dethiobacter sp.]|nr:single-stranded DNA-binding protein [Dethiobacter sp.]